MTDQEIMDKITGIIVELLGAEKESVTPEASFIDDLNADSIDQVELIMALENDFHLSIPEEEAQKLKTVQDAFNYIKEKM